MASWSEPDAVVRHGLLEDRRALDIPFESVKALFEVLYARLCRLHVRPRSLMSVCVFIICAGEVMQAPAKGITIAKKNFDVMALSSNGASKQPAECEKRGAELPDECPAPRTESATGEGKLRAPFGITLTASPRPFTISFSPQSAVTKSPRRSFLASSPRRGRCRSVSLSATEEGYAAGGDPEVDKVLGCARRRWPRASL